MSEVQEMRKKLTEYTTAPFDARFPNQNQSRNCYQNYLDFHRCEKSLKAKGKDIYICQWYKRVYQSLCPVSWFATVLEKQRNNKTTVYKEYYPSYDARHMEVEQWDEEREKGCFPGNI